ncbi:MAG: hypothetical protein QJR10_07995 [Bacillota bacterium]|nr:hypothetical protein [Bacillota bacterium]
MAHLRSLWTRPEMLHSRTSIGKPLPRCFSLCLPYLALLLAFVLIPSPATFAQENTYADSYLPLVYPVENSGAHFPAPNFPDFAHLPIIRPLPDPFRFSNGWRDTRFQSWERRRNEIKAAIEKYEIGPKPDCSDCTITASYTPPTATAKGVLTVNVTRNGKTLTLTSGVYVPSGMGNGPFPALIAMTFFSFGTGPNYGSLPASAFAGLPVMTLDFVHNQVTNYSFSSPSKHSTDPFYQLYPELCAGLCNGTSNSGQYAAWSWGVSRLIDGMQIASHQAVNPLPVDMKHLAVTGCSYAGKMALFAGAFDERIALTIAQENGGGGAPAWRVSREIEPQGSVEDVDDTNYDWFGGQMQQFAAENVYKLPEDHHELMAMVAPRALLETGNTDFYWLSNRSNYISARAAQQVYNTFGIGDRFGFYIDGGHQHCATLPAEAPAITAFVNKFLFGQMNVDTDVEIHPYPSLDYQRWTWWWKNGLLGLPSFPNDWNTGGTVVMALNNLSGFWRFPDLLWIQTGNMVNAGFQFSIPGNHPAATATLVQGNVQADIWCLDGSSYTMTIPLPANQSYSIPAGSPLWVPGRGTFQGSAQASGCSTNASPGILVNAYLSALNTNTGVGNPPTGTGVTSSDLADPLRIRFSCSTEGESTPPSPPLTVNFQP